MELEAEEYEKGCTAVPESRHQSPSYDIKVPIAQTSGKQHRKVTSTEVCPSQIGRLIFCTVWIAARLVQGEPAKLTGLCMHFATRNSKMHAHSNTAKKRGQALSERNSSGNIP